MSDGRDPVLLMLHVSVEQLEMIDRFHNKERLSSREEAMILLLDIALETVTGTGRRFWDKPIVARPEEEDPAGPGPTS